MKGIGPGSGNCGYDPPAGMAVLRLIRVSEDLVLPDRIHAEVRSRSASRRAVTLIVDVRSIQQKAVRNRPLASYAEAFAAAISKWGAAKSSSGRGEDNARLQ